MLDSALTLGSVEITVIHDAEVALPGENRPRSVNVVEGGGQRWPY